MKKTAFLLLVAGLFALQGCSDYVDEYVTRTFNEPVFMPPAEFRAAADAGLPKPIDKQGKIAFHNGYRSRDIPV